MDAIVNALSKFSIEQTAGAFIVLMAIIDVLGSTPIFLNLKAKGRPINAFKAASISLILLVAFFYAQPCNSSMSTSSRLPWQVR